MCAHGCIEPHLLAHVTGSLASRNGLFGRVRKALWEGERVCLGRVRRGDGESVRCNVVIVSVLLKARILALFAAEGTVGRKYAGFENVLFNTCGFLVDIWQLCTQLLTVRCRNGVSEPLPAPFPPPPLSPRCPPHVCASRS